MNCGIINRNSHFCCPRCCLISSIKNQKGQNISPCRQSCINKWCFAIVLGRDTEIPATELRVICPYLHPRRCEPPTAPWAFPMSHQSAAAFIALSGYDEPRVPVTCRILRAGRGLPFSQSVRHHCAPGSSPAAPPSALSRWRGSGLVMGEISPELCLLSEVVISCYSGPLLFFFNQCYCSVIYMQYNAPNLSVHFYQFGQIYIPMQPPPQSSQGSFPSLQNIPLCSFLVDLLPPSLVLGNQLSVFCHFRLELLFL